MSLQSVEAKLLAAKELVRKTLVTITTAQQELEKQYYELQTEIENLHSETQSEPVQTQSAPVQTQSAPVQTQSAPVQTQSAPVQTPSASVTPPPQAVTPQDVTPQPAQTQSALPTLLLVKRCGSLFLYQDMNGVIVAKKELLPQPTDIQPVPDSVSELNPLHFVVEYGTEGATKILERYTLEQLTQSVLKEKLETAKEIKTLTKEKLINLIVRRCVKRLNQDMVFIIHG